MPIHNFSGFLPTFELFGLVVPVYYAVISLAFIISMIWLVRRADARGLSRNRALDISLVLMISGFVGSRLFHVFYEEPAYYWARPSLVFDIWSGGFVWYGGALLAGVVTTLFIYLKKEPVGQWLDLFAPVCALGYAIGRTACILTGCCYGRVVHLPQFLGGELIRHPTQTYAVVSELVALALLLTLEKFRSQHQGPLVLQSLLREPGQLFFCWLAFHACGRLIMETFRDDPRGPMPLGLSISTWLSLGLLVSAAAVLISRAGPRLSAKSSKPA